jgi:hypothetical protein
MGIPCGEKVQPAPEFSQVPFGDGIASPEILAESRQAAMSGLVRIRTCNV